MSVVRHTGYNIAGAVIPIIISLIATPLLLREIGLSRYGLLSICWILLSHLGMFDLGTSRAVAQRMAVLGSKATSTRNQVFWTSLLICCGLSVLCALVILSAAPWVAPFLRVDDPSMIPEFETALNWLAVAVPMTMLYSQFVGTLEGIQRFGFVNTITTISNSLIILLPLYVAVFISPRLDGLVMAAAVGRSLGTVAMFVGALRLLPVGAPALSVSEGKRAMSYGGWMTISNAISPIIVYADRFLVGRLMGASAVGLYALPFVVMMQILILPSASMRALFPKLAANEEDEARSTVTEALATINWLLSLILAGVSIVIVPFLCIWLGPTTGLAASPVAFGLMLGVWSNGLAMVLAAALQARAKNRYLAILHSLELVPFLIVLYLAVENFGLVGAALAWSARCAIDGLFIYRRDRIPVDWRGLAVSGALLGMIVAIALTLPPTSPGRWVATGVCALALAFHAYRNTPPAISAFASRNGFGRGQAQPER